METFETILAQIEENSINGYETAILGANKKAYKYGSLMSDYNEMPDLPANCSLMIWNNENIDNELKGYEVI